MRFLMYYHYENLSLIDSALALLKLLNIDVSSDDNFKYHGGHWAWLVNEEMFFTAQGFNIAKASSKGCDLLVLEEDAYLNLIFAKRQIDENPMLLNLINSALDSQGLKYSQDTKIVFLLDLLSSDEILNKLDEFKKVDYKNFSVSVFHSSLASEDSMNLGLRKLLNKINLKVAFETNFACFQNELFAPNLSYKYSAKLLESALDCGSDFILAQSMGAFEMLDKKRKKLSNALNREMENIGALFLPQVILLSLGIRDDVRLGLRYHKILPEFL